MSENTMGSFLAALRKAKGMTQRQLAEKLNVSDKAVSRWERDECAPDLSVIPVLAELYGVTCEEIIRGQRLDREKPEPRAEEKSQKRLVYLLKKMEAEHKIRSLISLGIALTGLLVALLLNFAFTRGVAACISGGVFTLAAVLCQVIFGIRGESALDSQEFDGEALDQHKKALFEMDQRVYTGIALIFGGILPFGLVGNAYWGLPLGSYLLLAVLFVAAIFGISRISVRVFRVKRGYAQAINWKSPENKRRLRFWLLGLGVLVVLYLGHLFLDQSLTSRLSGLAAEELAKGESLRNILVKSYSVLYFIGAGVLIFCYRRKK